MELAYRTTGNDHGLPPLLLIHGGAEDADLLTAQAEAIAATGRRVIWYDRRGTGNSTRQNWPGAGADQHADDAAELLRGLLATPAVVLGLSSGGIVGLALAARHPDTVHEVIAWETPVVTVLPDGLQMQEAIMAPTEEYLRDHPEDWAGAFPVLLQSISGGRADLTAPAVQRMARNAEALIRDDGRAIVSRSFDRAELSGRRIRIAIGENADPAHVAMSEGLAALVGQPVERVPGAQDHEVYVTHPEVLAGWLTAQCAAQLHPAG
jgi:pimeloyl-ACP methyl ester carboxylesterase